MCVTDMYSRRNVFVDDISDYFATSRATRNLLRMHDGPLVLTVGLRTLAQLFPLKFTRF
jgi:hypothetical protein